MKTDDKLSNYKAAKVLIPAFSYNLENDTRMLIPFLSKGLSNSDLIGFVNREGVIVVKPTFSAYFGEFYSDKDQIKVAVIDTYGFPRKSGGVSTYHRLAYGVINAQGSFVVKPDYLCLVPSIGGKTLFSVQSKNYQYGVIDEANNIVIPFGKYLWVDGFDHGLARVITNSEGGKKIGIINENGAEVVPPIYDDIWNFYGKNRNSTRSIIGGTVKDMPLNGLRGLE